jgi:hypothetical protein
VILCLSPQGKTNLTVHFQESYACNVCQRTDRARNQAHDGGMQSALRCQSVSVSAKQLGPLILVAENVEEIRDGIQRLLESDGYRVDPARQKGLPCKDRRATSPNCTNYIRCKPARRICNPTQTRRSRCASIYTNWQQPMGIAVATGCSSIIIRA